MARRSYPQDDAAELANQSFDAFNRLDPLTRMVVVALLVLAALALFIGYEQWRKGHAGAVAASGLLSPQMVLGNPSSATADAGNPDNYLMLKPYFALSYNSTRGIPNWVSWRLSPSDLGDAPRSTVFSPDSTLPPGFNQVKHGDYAGSGFDQGHMCPHSDRAANTDMSFSTFVMTNIIPQAPNVNRKAWEQLESYGRELVQHERDRLYIISGPAGQGGRGSRGAMSFLPRGQVVVPAACWKIIVVIPNGGDLPDNSDDVGQITASTRVIAVLMPNDQSQVADGWAQWRTSPARIEQQTGLHFFDRLPPAIASALRERVDTEVIPRQYNHRHF